MNVLNAGGVRLAGVVACLPKTVVDMTVALGGIYGEKAAGIVQATGIKVKRLADPGVNVVDLCVAAAERVFEACGVSPEAVGTVIGVSFTNEDRMPCMACQAQARLGLPREVVAFDVSLACSGWGYGLYLAGLLARQTGKRVLLLDGDVQSAFLDPSDAATVPVLADGGTAALIEPCEAGGDWRFAFLSDGAQGAALRLPRGGTIAMDGFGVFRFVAKDVTAFLRDFMAATGIDGGKIDAFVPHQANVFMIRQLAKALMIPEGKLWISADRIGNISSASIPATLAVVGAARSGTRQVLFSGFGGGLSVSAGVLTVDGRCRLEVFDYAGRA